MATKCEFDVAMTCDSCSTAITEILTKEKESGQIESFDVSLENKKVSVTSSKLSTEEVTAILKKWGEGAGKEVKLVSS